MGPSFPREGVAGLPNGGGVTIHTESPLERASPPHIAKGVGLPRVPPPFVRVSLFGPVVLIAIERKEKI
jgi:hypothetical protein